MQYTDEAVNLARNARVLVRAFGPKDHIFGKMARLTPRELLLLAMEQTEGDLEAYVVACKRFVDRRDKPAKLVWPRQIDCLRGHNWLQRQVVDAAASNANDTCPANGAVNQDR